MEVHIFHFYSAVERGILNKLRVTANCCIVFLSLFSIGWIRPGWWPWRSRTHSKCGFNKSFLLLAKCYSFIVTFFCVIGFSGLPRTHGTPRTIRKTCKYIVVYTWIKSGHIPVPRPFFVDNIVMLLSTEIIYFERNSWGRREILV